jgi:hypothetical protein
MGTVQKNLYTGICKHILLHGCDVFVASTCVVAIITGALSDLRRPASSCIIWYLLVLTHHLIHNMFAWIKTSLIQKKKDKENRLISRRYTALIHRILKLEVEITTLNLYEIQPVGGTPCGKQKKLMNMTNFYNGSNQNIFKHYIWIWNPIHSLGDKRDTEDTSWDSYLIRSPTNGWYSSIISNVIFRYERARMASWAERRVSEAHISKLMGRKINNWSSEQKLLSYILSNAN